MSAQPPDRSVTAASGELWFLLPAAELNGLVPPPARPQLSHLSPACGPQKIVDLQDGENALDVRDHDSACRGLGGGDSRRSAGQTQPATALPLARRARRRALDGYVQDTLDGAVLLPE
jgi:hypothetical protein